MEEIIEKLKNAYYISSNKYFFNLYLGRESEANYFLGQRYLIEDILGDKYLRELIKIKEKAEIDAKNILSCVDR